MLEAVSIVSKCFGGVTQTGTTPAAGFADACFARAAVGWARDERNSVDSSDSFDFPKELVRRELAALRRLAIDRRDAATRLPVLKRSGLQASISLPADLRRDGRPPRRYLHGSAT
jgi:hypothetical protein